MLKSLILIALMFMLSSCGVDTSSSDLADGSDSNNTTVDSDTGLDGIGDGYITDSNPITGDDSDDTNTTDDSNSTDGGGDDNGGNGDSGDINSIFDHVDAIEDPFACMVGDSNQGYTNNSLADTSFDNQGEEDVEDGIGVNSRFPYNDDPLETEVRVYYYDLKPSRTMNIVSAYSSDYRVDVDTAWADNDETKLYVMTPKNTDGLYGCYRYDLSSIDTDNASLVATKVYRNEI